MKVRYTYRLRPGAVARAWLEREAGMCRFVWNELVSYSNDLHELWPSIRLAGSEKLTFGAAEADKHLTRLRQTTRDAETGERWLASGSSVAQQQTVRDFSASRSKALKDRAKNLSAKQRAGMPRFRKRDEWLPSMRFSTRGFSLGKDKDSGRDRLHLPGGVRIPVVWSRALPSAPSSVTVSKDSLGHWYASFVVEAAYEPEPPVGDSRAVGVDWGVTETATTAIVDTTTGDDDLSTDYDLPFAGFKARAEKDLATAQRRVSRRRPKRNQTASHGYRLAKFKAARAAKKVARQRKDHANKWAKRVARDFDQIAVEDFHPKFLAQTTMAKKSAGAGIAAAKQALIWQAAKAGRDLRLVNPAHTTMDCSKCGARTKHRLPLGQRTYTCEACGLVRPRDKNSAALMPRRAGFIPACVDEDHWTAHAA